MLNPESVEQFRKRHRRAKFWRGVRRELPEALCWIGGFAALAWVLLWLMGKFLLWVML